MENNEITINDGGGLYDDVGLIDTLIVDCNDLTGLLVSGRYVAFCSTVTGMVQKLGSLRESLQKRNDRPTGQIYEKKDVE